jgi:hypothetical protein
VCRILVGLTAFVACKRESAATLNKLKGFTHTHTYTHTHTHTSKGVTHTHVEGRHTHVEHVEGLHTRSCLQT